MLGTFGMFVFLQQGLFCCLRHWRAHCFKSEPTSFTINFPVCSSIFTFNLVSVCLFIFKCAEIETLKVKCVVQPEQRYFVKTVCVCVCVGSCPVWWSISTLIRWLKTVNTDCWSCSTSSPETGSESQNWKESGFFFFTKFHYFNQTKSSDQNLIFLSHTLQVRPYLSFSSCFRKNSVMLLSMCHSFKECYLFVMRESCGYTIEHKLEKRLNITVAIFDNASKFNWNCTINC